MKTNRYTSMALLMCMVSSFVNASELYRKPRAGDKGTYYVISQERLKNGRWLVVSSRVGKNNKYTDFTKLKINCQKMEFLTLGAAEADGKQMSIPNSFHDWTSFSKWSSLERGSSKSDLVQFVCNK